MLSPGVSHIITPLCLGLSGGNIQILFSVFKSSALLPSAPTPPPPPGIPPISSVALPRPGPALHHRVRDIKLLVFEPQLSQGPPCLPNAHTFLYWWDLVFKNME